MDLPPPPPGGSNSESLGDRFTEFARRPPPTLFHPVFPEPAPQARRRDDFESKVRANAPVLNSVGKSLDMWRNDSRPPVLGTNYIQRYIKLADASGLGTRELTTAPIHLSKADRQQREKIDDIIPYTVVLMDDYNPEAAVFRYTSGDQLLRMKVLQLKGYLRVSAEIIVDGKKQTILYSLTRSDSYELDDIRNGDRTGYNYWQSLCMTAKRNGDIEWFGDAMCGESFKAKLVNPTEAAPKLITMLRKLVLPDH